MLHRLFPIRGCLQELHIPQLHPSPAYTDSQSTIFCANSAASARLSVWLNRRSAVLREGVDLGDVRMEKISDADNVANFFTKPVTTSVMNHYFSYTHSKNRSVQARSKESYANVVKRDITTAPTVQVVGGPNFQIPALVFQDGQQQAPGPAPASTSGPEPAPAVPATAPASAHTNGILKCWCDLCGHNSRDGCLNRGWPEYNYRCRHCHDGCLCFCDDPRMTDYDTEDFTSD